MYGWCTVKRMELREAAKLFVNDGQKARPTRIGFTSTLNCLADDNPGLKLDQYRSEHLTKYCLSNTVKGRPAPQTIKVRRARLRVFFEWCVWKKFIDHNPASDLKFTVRTGSGGVRHHNWLDESQVAKLLASCADDVQGHRNRVLLMVGFFMGLRRTELASLRWDMFTQNFDRLRIVGKGSKWAELGVPPQLRVALADWQAAQPAGCAILWPTFHFDRFGTLLVADWETSLTPSGVAYVVAETSKKAGMVVRTHDMRRTFLGILDSQGVQITDISRLARHSNIGTTSVYLENNPARTARLADGFTINLGETA